MINKQNAKKLNRKNTIDLKEIYAREYLDSKKAKINLKTILIISLVTLFIVLGLNIYVYASIPLNDEFTTEFEKVLEKEEIIKEDIDKFVDELQEMVELDEVIEPQNHGIFPTEGVSIEPINDIDRDINVPIKKDVFNIDKLSYAVSMAETSYYTKGYGVSHNNGHGIKHGNTAPCPLVPKMYMCKFNTRLESHEAFKKIWSTWYGEFPNYKMAERWTGGDNTDDWLRIVNFYYHKSID